jgi:hypothetical protein
LSGAPRALVHVFMSCAPEHVFGGFEFVESRFHDLRTRTHFQRYRGRPLPDSFSAVPRAPSPVFKFCAPRLIFRGVESVGYHFHVLHAQTHFQWYRGRRVPFSCFAHPDSFSAVPKASGPVFMFCALDLVLRSKLAILSLCFLPLNSFIVDKELLSKL